MQLKVGRRAWGEKRRDHRVGPLRYNDREYATLRIVAAREGVDVGSYVATTSLAVAMQDLTPVPVKRRDELVEFIRARVAMNRLAAALGEAVTTLDSEHEAVALDELLMRVTDGIRRLEAAADAVAGLEPPS
ncbi:hypothetical protein [Nonomuraea sp. NPDC049400]|uniref:hypothetical protein n=1 Tax=Nonomuraea sp. NPDC049400 TaxID=3364352 RepID=UPI0037BAC363